MQAIGGRARLAVVSVALLLVLVGSQAAASFSAPPGGTASTGRVIGQTGFAYLGGIRTFAAAVIWNRLEPVFHDYYSGKSLSQMNWALPAMNLVQILDPQFLQAYYEASYNVYRMGAEEEGLRIARLGVENNPTSAFMRANYAQLLLIDDPEAHLSEMVAQADIGTGPEMYWTNDTDRYEGLAIFRTVYAVAGQDEKAAEIQHILDDLRATGVEVGDHDHDGDGKQDH